MNQTQPKIITSKIANGLGATDSSRAAEDSLPLSFWSAWRWWLPPALLTFVFVLYFVDPFIGDWDGVDYTMLSLAGYPSSMAFGRNLFIFGNHALYLLAHALFNVPPENAYLIFKYAVVAQSPLAVIACWVLARDFTQSIYSATIASLMIAASPVFILYGGQVMTDVPSVLLTAVALIVHFRGLRQGRLSLILLGAALLGLGVNLRETFAFFAPWLVLAPLLLARRVTRREIFHVVLSVVVFVTIGIGWFAYWFFTDAHYQRIWFGWRESLAQESARHPVSVRSLLPYFMYFCVTAPFTFFALPFAMVGEWRRHKLSPLLLLAMVGLFANLLLFLNYSTAVNWRYFLTGLPAIAPITADFAIRKLSARFKSTRGAFVSCIAALLTFGIVFGIYSRPVSLEYIQRRALSKEYKHQLSAVPRDAIMISGAQTIAVTYWKSMGLGDWKTIGTGGGWPGDSLVPQIQANLFAGKRVFLDSDPRWWLPCGWQRDEILAIVKLEDDFRFRRVTDTIYELRPMDDISAIDRPDLKRLLPENRPADTKKCAIGRA